ncbi:Fibronectin type-III domain-containing protein [Sergentomyia squamirostris]
MLILTTILAAYVALVGCYSSLAPENITVTFLNPTSVRVSWQTSLNLNNSKPIQKYDVTYKPTDASYRVVAEVAGNSEAVTLINLVPSTQYQLTVAALFNGKKYRSRPIVFRTLELSKTSAHQGVGALGSSFSGIGPPMSSQGLPDANYPMSYDEFGNLTNNSTTRELPTIRGVEVGIVVLVLIVWAGAIALFFNRWGKIRMLLPYQPDYKQEQGFKVPGTGVCSSGACNGQHSHQVSSQITQPRHTFPPLYCFLFNPCGLHSGKSSKSTTAKIPQIPMEFLGGKDPGLRMLRDIVSKSQA